MRFMPQYFPQPAYDSYAWNIPYVADKTGIYGFSPEPPYRQMGQQPLIHNTAKAVNGEYRAIRYYTRLAELAPDAQTRRIILKIRSDEQRHFQQFSNLYRRLTGREPQLTEPALPETYREGVRSSITEELEDAEFYQMIARETTNSQAQVLFGRAAMDEMRHAIWFMYLAAK
jgi:rubrerythrin